MKKSPSLRLFKHDLHPGITFCRVGLHSAALAGMNILTLLIGFRINRLLTHAIAVQIPVSTTLCIIGFVLWNMAFLRFPCPSWMPPRRQERLVVFLSALAWSPLLFALLHRVRWGYVTSGSDLVAIWLFQVPTNLLAFMACNTIVAPKHSCGPDIPVRSGLRTSMLFTNIAIALGSGVLTVIASELLLQGFYDPPQIVSGWRFTGTPLEMNQLRFRGQPIDYAVDDFVIILLGDSQVEATACAYEWMPERRLQHYLAAAGHAVKVFCLGAGGYGQDQQFLALQEYYQNYRADLVILWQTPTNDIWNNMFPTHWPTNGTPKPTFWIENETLHGPTEKIEETLREVPIKLVTLWRRAFRPIDRDAQWEKTYLPPAYRPLSEYHGPIHTDWQERWNTNQGLMRDENLDIEKSHLSLVLTPQSERMQYGIELTRRLLQEIEQLVTSHHGRFGILRVPRSLSTSPIDEEKVYILNGRYYRTSEKQKERNLQELNEGFYTMVIPITEEASSVGPADGHLNEHAVDRAMMTLAHTLSREFFQITRDQANY